MLCIFAVGALLFVGDALAEPRIVTRFEELVQSVWSNDHFVVLGASMIVPQPLTISHSLSISAHEDGLSLDGQKAVEILTVQSGANVLIEDVTMKDSFGSAITVESGGELELVRCTIIGSAGAHVGGAIVATRATVRAFGTRFVGNRATYGGAVALFDRAALLLVECDLKKNTAHHGGALLISQQSIVNSSSSHFEGNEAESWFTHGSNPSRGGAVYVVDSRDAEIDNCDFHSNSAEEGGAVAGFSSTIHLWSNAFVRNVAVSGGAVAVERVDIDGAHNIMTSNNAEIVAGGILAVNSNLDSLELAMSDNVPDGHDELSAPLSPWLFQVPTSTLTSSQRRTARRLGDVTQAPTYHTAMPTSS